ncbi:MAG: glycosyltransferase [Myxococcales bacterium]
MRTLHVAALAHPTRQGTQAALHSMLSALAQAGHDTHLHCYPLHDGAGRGSGADYQVHRPASALSPRSTRSGPSLEKLLLDALLARDLRPLCARLEPDVVIAHHVEAAMCCLRLAKPVLFMAHTSLAAELPSYFSPRFAGPLRGMGEGLDRFLCRASTRALAVSPLLADMLAAQSARPVSAIRVPWTTPEPMSAEERAHARRSLGLTSEHEVLLYAGNLDAYQDLDGLLEPLHRLARRRPQLRWLIATESSSREFRRRLETAGLASRVMFAPLADEAQRRRVHAAAQLALVPRGAPGGLPIKLLDALARGVPVVTTRRASAGLGLPSAAVEWVDDAGSWEQAIERVLSGQLPVTSLGRAYIEQAHSKERFVSDLIAHASVAQASHG